MSRKDHWMKLETGAVLADEELKTCSLSARGLWIYLLSLMHRSVRRGYLIRSNGLPWTLEQIALATGCSTAEVTQASQELLTSGVFSATDDGVLYSRRMVREQEISQKRSDAGRKGGQKTVLLKQNSSKGSSKTSSKPLTLTSLTREEEGDRECAEDLLGGAGGFAQAKSKQNGDPKLSVDDLAVRWMELRKGHRKAEEFGWARSTFGEMARHGCSLEDISREMEDTGRVMTEPIWEFENRVLLRRSGRGNGRTSETVGRNSRVIAQPESHSAIEAKTIRSEAACHKQGAAG